ncbi:MAG TPA: NAD-dependent epimerase/dehydratase family protein [Anaeromyxobacteraceae bacterium]|nr:NAD-dependent epimerase/dehydratase family protein [Anaeromyxobacteraceae bacterium]
MRVLVIGGNRFVGRLLVWRLLARGDDVTVLNRGRLADPFGDRVQRLVGDRTGPNLERLVGDATFDAVVDFAAYTPDDGRRAAKIFRDRTRHYVMVSTGQVYLVRDECPLPARSPAREEYYDGPLKPRPSDPADLGDWEYGVGKRDCEDALVAAAGSRFPATRIRIPMVNGPLDFHRRIEGYLWRLVDGGPVILPDGGEHLVRHVDGAEVARFVCDILLREATFGRAFNLAQDETPTLAALIDALRAQLGSRARIVSVPADRLAREGLRAADVSPFSGRWMSFLDPGRARDELGFRHAPLEQTIPPIVSAFLSFTPRAPPPGYGRRDVERRLAHDL